MLSVYRILLLLALVNCLSATLSDSRDDDDEWPSVRSVRLSKVCEQVGDSGDDVDHDDPDQVSVGDRSLSVKAERQMLSGECGGSTMRRGKMRSILSNLTLVGSDRVAGGYAAKPGHFPSYVFLTGENYVCGGTILSPQHVVTAAHCTSASVYRPGAIAVKPVTYMDETRVASGYIRAKKICMSPRFTRKPFPRHDIALIKLERPLDFNETVQAACLPSRPLTESDQAYAIGLGYASEVPKRLPETLQVMPVTKTLCYYDRHYSTLCLRSNKPQYQGDTCGGDSGGPLLAKVDDKWTLFGVTSYGPTCFPGFTTTGTYASVYDLRNELDELMMKCR